LQRRGPLKAPTKDFAVADDAQERPHLIYYRMAGKKRRAHGTWYRGEDTNYHPVRASLSEPDAVANYVGHGWFPAKPFIDRDQYITAFGSCFAAEVTKFLVSEGYRVFGNKLDLNTHIVRCGEGMVNSSALVQQFEWAFNNQAPMSRVWHDKDGGFAGSTDEMQAATRDIFLSSDVFILTVGLSEVWYDKVTEECFWRAVPKNSYDPDRHGFRVLNSQENRANLTRAYQLIRAYRPTAEIVLTLSPIPLAATFRPISCVTANSVSKASLRMAIDELMREFVNDAKLHYFPSYEIVTAFLEDPFGDDLRHLRPEAIEFIMRTFKQYYLC
jgi:hypothetical protein